MDIIINLKMVQFPNVTIKLGKYGVVFVVGITLAKFDGKLLRPTANTCLMVMLPCHIISSGFL